MIGYRTQNFEEALSDYDHVFDTMGGIILEKAFPAVKPQREVIMSPDISNERFAKEYGLPLWEQWVFKIATCKIHRLEQAMDASYHFLSMRPDDEQLALLTEFIEQGRLRPIIDRVVPFSQIQGAVNYSPTG